jgi:hypothetical protein
VRETFSSIFDYKVFKDKIVLHKDTQIPGQGQMACVFVRVLDRLSMEYRDQGAWDGGMWKYLWE